MNFCVLGSGSKGNCTYISSGKTSILIDAGFSGIEIQRRLSAIGIDFSSLSAILVTHEHNDHIRGVPVLSRKGEMSVYANQATYTAAGKNLNNLYSYEEFTTGVSFSCRDFEIHPFSISHDTPDPVGFIVSDGKSSIGYCTDTGTVSRLMHHRLSGCNGLILESNHDPDILKNGPYPPFLKQRVRGNKGHLANADAGAFLKDLVHDELVHVVLAHISETNNRPEIALETVTGILKNGETRQPDISIGTQDKPGKVVKI